jgi:hypothetical protein
MGCMAARGRFRMKMALLCCLETPEEELVVELAAGGRSRARAGL